MSRCTSLMPDSLGRSEDSDPLELELQRCYKLFLIPCFHSLRDTLVSYMETKDSDVLPEVESQFPEEILMSSCISVWKAAATRKQDRQAR